jgi:hypothetical protein
MKYTFAATETMQREVRITVQADTEEQARYIAEMWLAIPVDGDRDTLSSVLPAIRNSKQERWERTHTTSLALSITEGS